MSTSVFNLVGPALERTKQTLFRPFDLGKWFVVGFGCWLARLVDGGGGPWWRSNLNLGDGADAAALAPELPDWLQWSTLGVGMIVFLAIAGLVLLVALLWLSSRGKLIFLDNVAKNRAAIAEPWNRFAAESGSLFLWRLGFGLVAVLLIAALAAVGIAMGAASWRFDPPSGLAIVGALLIGLVVVALVFALMAVALFLDSFVVPIMALEGSTTSEAWGRFLPLLRREPVAFLLYAVAVVAVHLLLAMAVMVVGFGTCCLGFLFLAIPYVGTVVLLPVYVFLRALSLEFLAALEPSLNAFDLAAWNRQPAVGRPSPPPEPMSV